MNGPHEWAFAGETLIGHGLGLGPNVINGWPFACTFNKVLAAVSFKKYQGVGLALDQDVGQWAWAHTRVEFSHF